MKRLEFIKKTGLAAVGLPLLSSFELSKECLFVEDQVEREKFDFKIYTEYEKLGYYVRENGNIITGMEKVYYISEVIDEKEVYIQNELVHEYPYYRITKIFSVDDGYIRMETKYVGDSLAFGKQFIYDKDGKLTIVDQDKKFGKIKIDYIMNFLQEKGIIDLKTGAGWYNKDFDLNYAIDFFEEEKIWEIVLPEAEPYDPKKHGVPKEIKGVAICLKDYVDIVWYIDGETGQVYTKEEYKNRNKSPETTHTFQGKTYTEEEWKVFEQEQWEKYQAKRDKKHFWDKWFG